MSAKRSEPLKNLREKKNSLENKARLTAARIAGLLAGPALLLVILFLPLPLNWQQQCLLAVIVMTVTYWIFQPIPIPVTSILALTLAVILDVASARTVFGAFSSPTLFLLIGGFIITLSMIKYGLGKRIALAVLCLPAIGQSTRNIVIIFGLLAALLSAVIDNGAVASMLVPVAIGIVHTLSEDIYKQTGEFRPPLRFSTALMLITAYGATQGALLTPFGDATNMVGRQFIHDEFGIQISVANWMILSTPIVIVLFVLLATAVLAVNPPEVRHLPQAQRHFAILRRQLGPMSRGEKNTALVFGLAIFLWLFPAIAAVVGGYSSEFYLFLAGRFPPSVVAILAACCLFLLPVSQQDGFTMRWRDVREMDWGPVLLVGSALALGNLMLKTGLAETIGMGLAEKMSGINQIGVSFFASTIAILFSEISNNLVSITVLVPSIVPVAESTGGDPLVVILITTFSAIYGFMLPISTSANVIVYGSGQVPIWRMIKTGFFVDVSGILIIVLGITMTLRFVDLFS